MARMTEADLRAYEARQYRSKDCAAALAKFEQATHEAKLHEEIMAECKRRGWIALHGRMDAATGRTIGEPDFTILADKKRTIFVECKKKSGKPSPEQRALAAWAQKLGHTVHVVRSLHEFLMVVDELDIQDD